MENNKNFGNAPLTLVKSPRDGRDWKYGEIVAARVSLPEKVSLRAECGPVRSQGEAGFCHSFAGTALKNMQERQEYGDRGFDFSPLGLAKDVKARDGLTFTEGSTLLAVCKALCENGVFDEALYPYGQYQAGSMDFPPLGLQEGEKLPRYYCKNYARLEDLEDLKRCVSERNPVLLGITCTKEIYAPTDGCIGLPIGEYLIGGHALLVVGYDDTKENTIRGRKYRGFVECQNSWGKDYGDNGFLWIPYEYFTYRTKDFGIGFIMDMYAAVDLKRENLSGTAVELFLGKPFAYDDGKEVRLEQPPISDERTGRTLVPLRFIGEALGCGVEWNAARREICVRKGKREIVLQIGQERALVDGVRRDIEQAPEIDQKTGRTLVPLRFIAETLGNTVLWDGRRRKIIILKK